MQASIINPKSLALRHLASFVPSDEQLDLWSLLQRKAGRDNVQFTDVAVVVADPAAIANHLIDAVNQARAKANLPLIDEDTMRAVNTTFYGESCDGEHTTLTSVYLNRLTAAEAAAKRVFSVGERARLRSAVKADFDAAVASGVNAQDAARAISQEREQI